MNSPMATLGYGDTSGVAMGLLIRGFKKLNFFNPYCFNCFQSQARSAIKGINPLLRLDINYYVLAKAQNVFDNCSAFCSFESV